MAANARVCGPFPPKAAGKKRTPAVAALAARPIQRQRSCRPRQRSGPSGRHCHGPHRRGTVRF
eukprot:365357-Chlamydomonas_euryale.AAC.14